MAEWAAETRQDRAKKKRGGRKEEGLVLYAVQKKKRGK